MTIKKSKPKLIITGHARHGKDTVCEYLQTIYNYKFRSSSEIANEKAVYTVLKKKYGYTSLEECFTDRVNHRKEWFDLIVKYNQPDLSKLGKEIFAENDIYCGLRNIDELKALLEWDNILTVWVDASKRVPLENSTSLTITKKDCLYLLDNNKGLSNLIQEVIKLQTYIESCTLQIFDTYFNWRKP